MGASHVKEEINIVGDKRIWKNCYKIKSSHQRSSSDMIHDYTNNTYSVDGQLGSLTDSGGTVAVTGSAANRVPGIQVEVAGRTGVTAGADNILLKVKH